MDISEFIDSEYTQTVSLLQDFFQGNAVLSFSDIKRLHPEMTNYAIKTNLANINNIPVYKREEVYCEFIKDGAYVHIPEHVSYQLIVSSLLADSNKFQIVLLFLKHNQVTPNRIMQELHLSRATYYRYLRQINISLNSFGISIKQFRLSGSMNDVISFYYQLIWVSQVDDLFRLTDTACVSAINKLISDWGIKANSDAQKRLALVVSICKTCNDLLEVPFNKTSKLIGHFLNRYYVSCEEFCRQINLSQEFVEIVLVAGLAFIQDPQSQLFFEWKRYCYGKRTWPYVMTREAKKILFQSGGDASLLEVENFEEEIFFVHTCFYLNENVVMDLNGQNLFKSNDAIFGTHLVKDISLLTTDFLKKHDPGLSDERLSSIIDAYATVFFSTLPIGNMSVLIGIYSFFGALKMHYLVTYLSAYLPFKPQFIEVTPEDYEQAEIIITDSPFQIKTQIPVIQLQMAGSKKDLTRITDAVGKVIIKRIF
ncbi:helix-turn-helix domain-containing protein [Furfurilactobacillus entadae]|uniref:helix-turn-helix domain-containing protein n=1 Tax=Furfurilactobacillus entadae TaxID=2922307 RepID=UPI0035F0BFDB